VDPTPTDPATVVPVPPNGDALPSTGVASAAPLIGAGALAAVGAAAIAIGYRRRRA
jgi:LPXTG-motif cell wall-anchored protein